MVFLVFIARLPVVELMEFEPVFIIALGSNIKSPFTSPSIVVVKIEVLGPKTLLVDCKRLAIVAMLLASPVKADPAIVLPTIVALPLPVILVRRLCDPRLVLLFTVPFKARPVVVAVDDLVPVAEIREFSPGVLDVVFVVAGKGQLEAIPGSLVTARYRLKLPVAGL